MDGGAIFFWRCTVDWVPSGAGAFHSVSCAGLSFSVPQESCTLTLSLAEDQTQTDRRHGSAEFGRAGVANEKSDRRTGTELTVEYSLLR